MNERPRPSRITVPLLRTTVFSILVMVSSGQAADIRIVGIGSSYQLKITGPIKPGDNDKIRVAITEKAAFPDALLVEGDTGDIAESMAIGNFVRNNMLAITAGKNCSNTCFLIWTAGVHRRARGPIDARVITNDKAALRAYLTDMEIGGDIIANALSPESALLTDAMIIASEYSPRHRQWLTEQCGELTDQQGLDRQAIQALQSMEASLNAMGMGGSSMYTVSAETQREAARAQEFSPQYREELQKNHAEISSCRENVIAAVREEQGST
jgi:hypothetical protein